MIKKHEILLVEDDVLVLKTVEKLLNGSGYNVTAARNGEEALKVIKDKHFDLIISDIRMPGLDGIQTIERLKQVEQRPTPVILITGYASEEAPIDAVKLGVVDYILKPFNNEELLESVRRALEEKSTVDPEFHFLVKKARHIIDDYYAHHEHEIFENEEEKQFLSTLNNIVFALERKAIGKNVPQKK